MQQAIDLVTVESQAMREAARNLISEYLHWIADGARKHYGLSFDVDAMVASDLDNPRAFQPPGGRLYLLRQGDAYIGVGGFKRLSDTVAEVQRMYVQPATRGMGAGRRLLEQLVTDAGDFGYHTLRLESLKFLSEAHQLYRSAGFVDIPPYEDNSMNHYQHGQATLAYRASAVFMELQLWRPTRQTIALEAIDLHAKLASFEGHWQPRTVCEYNGHDVMVVRVEGDYQWHSHPDTDDFFLVLKGELEIDLASGQTVRLGPGQMYVVPRGVKHRPRAAQETHLLLIEPTGTPNSGDAATAAPRRVI